MLQVQEMDQLLDEAPALDEQQRAALDSTAALVQVVGPPGSGRSTLAVELVVDRVRRGLVAPDRALLLTSSRVAAARLRDRVTARLGVTTTTPLARTVQSLGFGLLRSEAALAGDPAPRLLSGPEQDTILKELLDGHATGVVPGPRWPDSVREALGTRGFRGELRDLLMRAVERGLVPEDLVALAEQHGRPEWRAAAAVLEEYDQVTAFSRPGAYDPAWVLSAAADRLEASEEALRRARDRFGLVVVDDAQELTWSAARLLSVVRDPSCQLVLLGDPDVAVETFRGGDPRVFARDWEEWFGGQDLLSLGESFVLSGSHRQAPLLAAVTGRAARQVGVLGSATHRLCADPREIPASGGDGASGAAAPSGPVEAVVLASAAQEAAYIAGRLRRAHLLEGVPWSRMAVIVRGRARSVSLRRVLGGSGVPVASSMTDLPVRDEPAARALLTLLQVAVRVARRDPRPLEPDVAVELLLSPVGGCDPVTVRRLRRSLRRAHRPGGERRRSDELLVQAVLDGTMLDDVPDREAAAARRVARALTSAATVARLGPDGRWPAEVTAELVLWHLWSGLGVADGWRAAAIAGGPVSARFDRHLDGVVALFGAAAGFAERLPGAGPEAFLEQVLAQELAADSLVPQAPLEEVVQVLTPQGAAGEEWDLVVVAGLQEGVWPDLRLRGSLLGSEHLVDLLAGRGHGPREALAAVRSDEARLLTVAVSRARQVLVATAVSSEDEQPSSYLDVIDPSAGDARATVEVPPPLSLTAVVAELRRRTLSDDEQLRTEAAQRLAVLASAGVAGADPDSWWGMRSPTRDDPVHPPDAPVPVSPSRLETVQRCGLMWFLRSHGGEAGDSSAAQVGTLVHEIAADPAIDLTDPAALRAELDRRWPELELSDSWASRNEHHRAVAMVTKLAAYAQASHDQGWRLVGVERDARVAVGRALLTGRVDRLEQDASGRLRVIDLKTGSGSGPTQAEIGEHPQLAAYQAAVAAGAFEESSESAGAALLQVGGKAQSYRLQPQASVQDAEDPTWARRLVEEAAGAMSGAAFAVTPGDHCGYCPVRRSCPAMPEGRQL
ncbi:ATP-dependent helicase [Arsenicicoccus sp. oral taxon 190]|uniref:ATP-dependent helicase n=1 Tax=Arsenicicoccus sp. oral taxon 190 TaxID=1658671 RepID=UPI00067A19CE|nr:ATP-dependent DNA helicase [Arsenicicoccus sp. oral taxon 190]AKT51395.1 hypothetical protein ADJ73_08805 [Arsenicicoccus sp. oral taxon 190]